MSRANHTNRQSPGLPAPARGGLAAALAFVTLAVCATSASAAEAFRCPPPEALVAVDWLWLDHRQRPCANRDEPWCAARARYTAEVVGSAGSRPEATITDSHHRPPRLFVEAQAQAPWPGKAGGAHLVCRYSQDQNITSYLFEVRLMTGWPDCRFPGGARSCQGRAEGCTVTCR